jgi:uncharacterized membrane protein YraQ (UPF0718 family)
MGSHLSTPPSGGGGSNLEEILSSAGATIGIIIAGTIFLQFLNTKYADLSGRYRELAIEYRGRHAEEPRHGPLRSEIRTYRERLRLMHRASILAAVALLFFLGVVLIGGIAMLLPAQGLLKWIGTGGLFLGLALIASAVLLELAELIMSRHELGEEIADLDDGVRSE